MTLQTTGAALGAVLTLVTGRQVASARPALELGGAPWSLELLALIAVSLVAAVAAAWWLVARVWLARAGWEPWRARWQSAYAQAVTGWLCDRCPARHPARSRRGAR